MNNKIGRSTSSCSGRTYRGDSGMGLRAGSSPREGASGRGVLVPLRDAEAMMSCVLHSAAAHLVPRTPTSSPRAAEGHTLRRTVRDPESARAQHDPPRGPSPPIPSGSPSPMQPGGSLCGTKAYRDRSAAPGRSNWAFSAPCERGMQNPATGLRRIPLPRTPLNRLSSDAPRAREIRILYDTQLPQVDVQCS